MYKLIYFKATNIIGFMSGLSRKTVEIDLTKFQDKDLIIIFGDNASGKSTFLSLIHPWHLPTDGRNKFVIPGKEGTILRTYLSEDGVRISTKCVYSPKRGGDADSGHTTKCYFSISRPGKDEAEELNPTGNVTSYQALLYTYFGLNKEFISFATYNNNVATIVKQTDSERKNSMDTMVPNTAKYEVSYRIVNDRYKELRTLIRSVSEKILSLRDQDSLEADMFRVNKELELYRKQWREASDKLAKAEGRLKELTKGSDPDDMIDQYNKMVREIQSCDHRIRDIKAELAPIYDRLGIDMEENGIGFHSTDEIQKRVMKYERLTAKTDAVLHNYQDQLNRQRDQLYKVENELMEMRTAIDSIDIRDMDELLRLKKQYQDQLDQMEYSKHREKYENMSYDEVVSFSRTLSMIHTMIQALYDEYGELVTRYFHDLRTGTTDTSVESRQKLQIQIESNHAKKDALFREYVEKDQYRKFQSILDQRPKTCTIDTCPFIANALKWSKIADEVAEIKKQYEDLNLELIQQTEQLNEYDKYISLRTEIRTLCDYVIQHTALFKKYLNLGVEEVYLSFEKATWMNVLDISKLKSLAAILSEKSLYISITTVSIPEVDHAIEMTKLYGTNKQLMQNQMDRLRDERKRLKASLSEYELHVHVTESMVDTYTNKLQRWHTVLRLVSEYKEVITRRLQTSDQADKQIETIHQMEELKEKIRRHKVTVKETSEMIEERTPLERRLQLDYTSLMKLKNEKIQIEQEFLIIEIIRMILMPGKGMRKELINIYMYDIYQTANQLLLNTFNGNLYLKEFIITDKEFVIPYVYNGTMSSDVSVASSSQQSAIAIAISMAILSKVLSNYGIVCFDEADAAFSPANREIFIDILTSQLDYIGIKQAFFITHHPEEYSGYPAGFLQFPGGKLKGHNDAKIVV